MGLLFGCGDGGDVFMDSTPLPSPGGGNAGGDTTAIPAGIQLLVGSPQLASAGTDAVTLTAIVKDSNNVLMEGVDVAFSADSGNIQITRSTTDATGTAEAKLTTAGDKTNRAVGVRASTGAISATSTV